MNENWAIYLGNIFQKTYIKLEQLIWCCLGIWIIYHLSHMIFFEKSLEEFTDFLAQELFWTIVGLEVLKMVYFRIIRKTNLLILYHFTILVTMTFCRQIVLKHELEVIYTIGLLISIVSMLILWVSSHENNFFSRFFEK